MRSRNASAKILLGTGAILFALANGLPYNLKTMSEAQMMVMKLNDAIALVERHVDQVVEVTGLSRKEAYALVTRHPNETAKRIGVDVKRVIAIACDGLLAEGRN